VIVLACIVGLGAAALLLMAGYLLGVAADGKVRDALREENRSLAESHARLEERAAAHGRDDGELRSALETMLIPLLQREQLSMDMSRIDGQGGAQRDISTMLDRMAERGNFSAVLLSDEQGWPLAASRGAGDPARLVAISSVLMLLADRMQRDAAPPLLSLMVHDASNMSTLCRLFTVNAQRLVLTVVAPGGQLTPAALDPALVRLHAALVDQRGAPDAGEADVPAPPAGA
jgi:hypothetical protein